MNDVAIPDLLGGLARPEPPGEADLHPALATASATRTMERNSKYVDPLIPPKTRLLTGARLIAGNQGADRDTYKAWQQDRSQPSPTRKGTDTRQAMILAAPDVLERGKALGGDEKAAAWLEATDADPIDVARFDRAAKIGRAAELWGKMTEGRLDDDEAFKLAEMVTKTGQVLEDFDDDLTLGGGRVVDVGDRVRVHFDDEPAPGVVTALNLDTLPLDALDGDVDGDGFEALIGDDIVVAAPVESQSKLRRAFPAVSKGGTPRWLSVQPAVVRGLLRAVDSAGFDPNAHVNIHLSGHPALAPYDSFTFTTSDQKRADRFRGLGAEHLGRGIAAVPRYKRRLVTPEDLTDPQTADDLVASSSWAIFDPNDRLDAGIYTSIPVRSADRDLVMVFGISPDEAAEATSGFAYVNDGIAIEPGYDGLEPYEADPAWFELDLRDGRTYRFSGSREEALLWPERTQRGVERWQIPLDENSRLEGLAAHLETLGAEDVAAYTSRASAGFTEAREVLWGDGTGAVASSRVSGLRSGPNVVPVWLRNTSGIPETSRISEDLLDTGEAEAAAELVDGRWRYDARGYPDIAETVRWAHTLGQKYGYDNVEIETDAGKLELVR